MINRDCRDLVNATLENATVKREDNFTTRTESERYTIKFNDIGFEYSPYYNTITWSWDYKSVYESGELENIDCNFTEEEIEKIKTNLNITA
ncbi:hypothetical protein [Vibrio splendidus]|uniref:hypothetical protein n=1 Tax=Vibrio splendidus TaxID=29497 RepID=UPI003D0E37C3